MTIGRREGPLIRDRGYLRESMKSAANKVKSIWSKKRAHLLSHGCIRDSVVPEVLTITCQSRAGICHFAVSRPPHVD